MKKAIFLMVMFLFFVNNLGCGDNQVEAKENVKVINLESVNNEETTTNCVIETNKNINKNQIISENILNENNNNIFILQLKEYELGQLISSVDKYILKSSENFDFENGKDQTFYYEFNEDYPLDSITIYVQYVENVNYELTQCKSNFYDDIWLLENNVTLFHLEDTSTIIGDGFMEVCTYTKNRTDADYIEVWLNGGENTFINITMQGSNLDVYDAYTCLEELFAIVLEVI